MQIANPGLPHAILSVSLPQAIGQRLTWAGYNPEFICRIDSASSAGLAPLEPDLEDNEEWVTFLLPRSSATDPNRSAGDLVIDAISAGFQPPEAIRSWYSRGQAMLAEVYPPGEQVDPSVTTGPWYNRNWSELKINFPQFSATLSGGRGGGWWPPKPYIQVTFMPSVSYPRLYPYGFNHAGVVDLIAKSEALGWHVDQGEAFRERSQSVTGDKVTYGWRCSPLMAWYAITRKENQWHDIPPFAYGAARDVGEAYSDEMGSRSPRCPDDRINAWEAAVPNGVYLVTASYSGEECTFENVRGDMGAARSAAIDTSIFSVEVADGRFTLSSSGWGCRFVNWLKLDLISSTLYPEAWLPAPKKEWWQLELHDPAVPVGLVQIRMPHESFTTAASYPFQQGLSSDDCRKMWLYSPAKCYRMFVNGRKPGPHPHLVSYPNFPGFTQPFLEWLFDQHDTNGDGILLYAEFRAAASRAGKDGTYALWNGNSKFAAKPTV